MEKIKKALDGKKLKVPCYGEVFEVVFNIGKYFNRRTAIQLIIADTGEPFCVLSVNIPECELELDEVLIKTWSENEGAARVARNSGLFQDTGKRFQTGFTVAEIWKVL